MAPYGTPVQSLAKGKIVRIVNNWSWEDFKRLKTGDLTSDDEIENLDIFRGNQIWLQTMDGNVTFYSHLSAISPKMTLGSLVESGTTIGNIGTSGVPDKNYKNIHLHFEIQQNPFIENQKNPTPLDIMRWDYLGKNLSVNEVRQVMREKFDMGKYEIAKK
jgi:murein DD-endopeptidase MepM/ murein hydrolase activator NlpD